MAAERRVSIGYEYIRSPLGFNGTTKRSNPSMTAANRMRVEFRCDHPDTPSIHSPTGNKADRAKPRANPACRFTQRNVSGSVDHKNLGVRSERSRINSHKLVNKSEITCGRTPQTGTVAHAAQSVASPAIYG